MLKVKFIGAIQGVTGSCSWLWHTGSGTQFLVDCGIFQGGPHHVEWSNRKPFPFDPSEIQYVLLTHAHLDHCGLIPRLVAEGFKGWVYCTQATRDVARELLADAAKISGLYTQDDVDSIHWHTVDDGQFSWGRKLTLGDDLIATFNRGSHVLGGCSISVSWAKSTGDKPEDFASIHFSGDLGCQTDENPYLPLLKPDHSPYPNAEYIVTEATYGDRLRESKCWKTRTSLLSDTILRTVAEKGGKVLIPTFAFHRMQELIADIRTVVVSDENNFRRKLAVGKQLTILCHSPLSNRLNGVYGEQLVKVLANGNYQYLNKELAGRAQWSASEIAALYTSLNHGRTVSYGPITISSVGPKKGKAAESFGQHLEKSDVILASSGMCDQGPSSEYLKMLRDDPRNTIILTGFQARSSAGRALLEDSDQGAEVVDMSSHYSGHGDQQKLLDNIFELGGYKGRQEGTIVFINHGEPGSKETFRAKIMEQNREERPGQRKVAKALIANDDWFDLDAGDYAKDTESLTKQELQEEIERLQKLLQTA